MLIGPAPVGLDERPDIPQRVKRWPDRSRCYKCRCYLSFIVVDRLYCSYECAEREPPYGEPTPRSRPGKHVPRQCTIVGRKKFKRRYFTLGRAQEAIRESREPGLSAYYCDYCNYFHMGHARPDAEAEALRQREEEIRLKRAEQRETRREERKRMKERARRAKQREQISRREKKDFEESIEMMLDSRRRYRRSVLQQRRTRRSTNGRRSTS